MKTMETMENKKKLSTKEKLKSAKTKAVQFYKDHEGVIWLIGGTAVGILSLIGAVKLDKHMREIQEQFISHDNYTPVRLFDKNGKEFRLFQWDSGNCGDPMDAMFFPDIQVGWSKEIDWDKL
jgi:hypothetical protein